MHSGSITNKAVKSILCIGEFWEVICVLSLQLFQSFVFGIHTAFHTTEANFRQLSIWEGRIKTASWWNQSD